MLETCFSAFVIKVPDDGSDEPKHVTHCSITLCLHTTFVFQHSSAQHDESE